MQACKQGDASRCWHLDEPLPADGSSDGESTLAHVLVWKNSNFLRSLDVQACRQGRCLELCFLHLDEAPLADGSINRDSMLGPRPRLLHVQQLYKRTLQLHC